MKELKKNRCYVNFWCDDRYTADCFYYAVGRDGECKYMTPVEGCTSKVAQVNAMTLKLSMTNHNKELT